MASNKVFYMVEAFEAADSWNDESGSWDEKDKSIILGIFSSFGKAYESGKIAFESIRNFTITECEVDSQILSDVAVFYKDIDGEWEVAITKR